MVATAELAELETGGLREELGELRKLLPAPLSSSQFLCQIRPHGVDEADHALQRRVVAQVQVLLQRDVEGLADGLEGLGLLHRVDAQVGFHVQVQLQHLLG
jgi:hypothetical protein